MAMAWEDAMDSFCRPMQGGIWDTKLSSGFGPYTPCLVDTVIINLSNLALIFISLCRIRSLFSNTEGSKFKVKSSWGHAFGILLAGFCAGEPVVQIFLDISAVSGDDKGSLPPFEVTFCPSSSLSNSFLERLTCFTGRLLFPHSSV